MRPTEEVHGADMRPGPAPLTDNERSAAEARTLPDPVAAKPAPRGTEPATIPVYLADAGDHGALLNAFLDAHGEFEKWRTWSDETTTPSTHPRPCASSVSTKPPPTRLRGPCETAWTVAAYETPVSQRMWYLTATATASTPEPVVRSFPNRLADKRIRETDIGTPVDEETVTAATQPLTDAGWKHAIDGRWIVG